MKKVAVFVDWDNLRNIIEDLQRATSNRQFNYNNTSHLTALFKSFLENGEEFYRIYIYTAEHLTTSDIMTHLNAGNKRKFQHYLSRNIDYEKKITIANNFF